MNNSTGRTLMVLSNIQQPYKVEVQQKWEHNDGKIIPIGFKQKLVMQNTIRIEDINFRTSFHGSKRNVPEQAKQKRIKYKHSLNLSAEQESLILLPNQRSSIPRPNYEILHQKLAHQFEGKNQSQSMPIPKLSDKTRKNSVSVNQNSIKLNDDTTERGTITNREKPTGIKQKQKSYQQLIRQFQKQEQEGTPKNQRLKCAQALPQQVISHKLKYDKMREYLKVNRNVMLIRRDESPKKKNSCSLPAINNFNFVLQGKVGDVTWVKNMMVDEKPLEIQIDASSLKRNLEEKFNAIHERQHKKLAFQKALKKRKQLIKHQRAQTQINSQPLQMSLKSGKKKLAKKYEENLRVQYDQLMEIYKRGQSSELN